jgi:hypothetical protein
MRKGVAPAAVVVVVIVELPTDGREAETACVAVDDDPATAAGVEGAEGCG